jgi:hypothetical protein
VSCLARTRPSHCPDPDARRALRILRELDRAPCLASSPTVARPMPRRRGAPPMAAGMPPENVNPHREPHADTSQRPRQAPSTSSWRRARTRRAPAPTPRGSLPTRITEPPSHRRVGNLAPSRRLVVRGQRGPSHRTLLVVASSAEPDSRIGSGPWPRPAKRTTHAPHAQRAGDDHPTIATRPSITRVRTTAALGAVQLHRQLGHSASQSADGSGAAHEAYRSTRETCLCRASMVSWDSRRTVAAPASPLRPRGRRGAMFAGHHTSRDREASLTL